MSLSRVACRGKMARRSRPFPPCAERTGQSCFEVSLCARSRRCCRASSPESRSPAAWEVVPLRDFLIFQNSSYGVRQGHGHHTVDSFHLHTDGDWFGPDAGRAGTTAICESSPTFSASPTRTRSESSSSLAQDISRSSDFSGTLRGNTGWWSRTTTSLVERRRTPRADEPSGLSVRPLAPLTARLIHHGDHGCERQAPRLLHDLRGECFFCRPYLAHTSTTGVTRTFSSRMPSFRLPMTLSSSSSSAGFSAS